MSELAKLAAGMDLLLAQMRAAEKAADPATAARLQGLSAQLREQHAVFAAEMEKVSADQRQKLDQARKDLESLKQQSAQARQQVAAAQAAAQKKPAAAAPPPPPTPIDPELARKNRVELLKRFGGLADSPGKPDWELWNQLDQGLQ